MQVGEVAPHHGVNAGRAGHAMFTHKEMPKDGFGFGVVPWINVTAEGVEGAMLPESEDLKQATLRFMRASTTMVATTTAAAIEQRVVSLLAGQGIPPRNPAHIFPPYTAPPMGSGAPPFTQGIYPFGFIDLGGRSSLTYVH